jgi:hypothetical protein
MSEADEGMTQERIDDILDKLKMNKEKVRVLKKAVIEERN